MVVVGVESMVSRSRLKQLASAEFGRVLVIIVIPETAVVFSLALALVTLGIIDRHLAGTAILASEHAARIVLGLQVYAATALALPIATHFSNRVRDISNPRQWIRALSLMEAGAAVPIIGLAWAFFQLGAS